MAGQIEELVRQKIWIAKQKGKCFWIAKIISNGTPVFFPISCHAVHKTQNGIEMHMNN